MVLHDVLHAASSYNKANCWTPCWTSRGQTWKMQSLNSSPGRTAQLVWPSSASGWMPLLPSSLLQCPRWSLLNGPHHLFLGRFNLTLTYRPGHKNQKPDALSHQFTYVEEEEVTGETIVSPSCVVGPVRWQVEQEVCIHSQKAAHLDGYFFPHLWGPPVLQCGHASKG